MRKITTIGALVLIATIFIAGCEKEEGNGTLLGEKFIYAPFPQTPEEIPDPDTLEYYPYNPNITVPLDFTVLGYTRYPEPDSSQVDSADWAIWIPKSDSMPPIAEFLGMERWIPAETTLARILEEEGTGGPLKILKGNNCDFSNNKRGDILLVTASSAWQIYGYWTHSLLWLRNTGADLYRTITSHYAPKEPARNGVHYEKTEDVKSWYPRCAVFRVTTWPCSESLRSQAADYAENQLGKPYNIFVIWKYTQDAFYCSQLDWAGYWWKSNLLVDVDVNVPIYIPHLGIIPDWHVYPDELFLSLRTYKIADSKK